MKPLILPTPVADAQADIVAVLREALARAEQGEFSNVVVFASIAGTARQYCTWNDPADRMALLAHLTRATWILNRELEGAG